MISFSFNAESEIQQKDLYQPKFWRFRVLREAYELKSQGVVRGREVQQIR